MSMNSTVSRLGGRAVSVLVGGRDVRGVVGGLEDGLLTLTPGDGYDHLLVDGVDVRAESAAVYVPIGEILAIRVLPFDVRLQAAPEVPEPTEPVEI